MPDNQSNVRLVDWWMAGRIAVAWTGTAATLVGLAARTVFETSGAGEADVSALLWVAILTSLPTVPVAAGLFHRSWKVPLLILAFYPIGFLIAYWITMFGVLH